MAIEDAMMIARCVRDIPGPASAFARYEELRRPRAERIVRTGRQRGAYKAPESRAALWVRDMLMPVALRMFANEKAMAWIYDYTIPWDARVRQDAA